MCDIYLSLSLLSLSLSLSLSGQLVQILLKKFCVTDNPKKFSLYEEYGGDCKFNPFPTVHN